MLLGPDGLSSKTRDRESQQSNGRSVLSEKNKYPRRKILLLTSHVAHGWNVRAACVRGSWMLNVWVPKFKYLVWHFLLTFEGKYVSYQNLTLILRNTKFWELNFYSIYIFLIFSDIFSLSIQHVWWKWRKEGGSVNEPARPATGTRGRTTTPVVTHDNLSNTHPRIRHFFSPFFVLELFSPFFTFYYFLWIVKKMKSPCIWFKWVLWKTCM